MDLDDLIEEVKDDSCGWGDSPEVVKAKPVPAQKVAKQPTVDEWDLPAEDNDWGQDQPAVIVKKT